MTNLENFYEENLVFSKRNEESLIYSDMTKTLFYPVSSVKLSRFLIKRIASTRKIVRKDLEAK